MTTPDTSAYMIGGYAVFFVVMAIYLTSLYLRQRRLRDELTTLEQLERPKPARTAGRPGTGKGPGGRARPGSGRRPARKS